MSRPPIPPPPPEPQAPSKVGSILGLIGGVAVVFGSFLPWATVQTAFGGVSLSGMEGDGKILVVGGAIVGILALLELANGQNTRVVVVVLSAVIVGLGLYEYSNVSEAVGGASSEFARASVGIGIYAILGGERWPSLAGSSKDRLAQRATGSRSIRFGKSFICLAPVREWRQASS
jgi:hypothetical protein